MIVIEDNVIVINNIIIKSSKNVSYIYVLKIIMIDSTSIKITE